MPKILESGRREQSFYLLFLPLFLGEKEKEREARRFFSEEAGEGGAVEEITEEFEEGEADAEEPEDKIMMRILALAGVSFPPVLQIYREKGV